MCFFMAEIPIRISGWIDRIFWKKMLEMPRQKSGCNAVSLGIFAWSALEPEEGVFRLDWMGEDEMTGSMRKGSA